MSNIIGIDKAPVQEEEIKYKQIDLITFLGLSPQQVGKVAVFVSTANSKEKTLKLEYAGTNAWGNKLANTVMSLLDIIQFSLLGAVDLKIPEKELT